MSLGDRLKERRVMLNLSRKKLSEITYITPQALANYENGISTPKPDILIFLKNGQMWFHGKGSCV